MLKTQQDILANYQFLIRDITDKLAKVKTRLDQFSFVRVSLLIAEIFVFISFVKAETDLAILIGAFALILPIAIFVVVVKKQAKITKHERYLKNLLWVYENEVGLINGKENKYDKGEAFEDENHPYLADLDVFGKYSLFALTNRCSTKDGIENLAKNLKSPNSKADILDRQKAIKELIEVIDTTFSFRANLKGHDVTKIAQIQQKLKDQFAHQLLFTQNTFLRIYIKILPFLISFLFLAAIVIGGKFWGILTLIAFVNAFITFLFTKKVNLVYYGFSGGANILSDYAVAIKWTEDKNWQSSYLKNLFESEDKVSEHIKKLSKIIQAFDARLNILLSAILNFFLLWDLGCCIQLEKWHQLYATKVENGLKRIGEFEELIAIATLSYNHPDWTFPIISEEFCLITSEMGHPLILKHNRIVNDFNLFVKPTVDIVTGSNMAGKSTFLRTVGINMVLAYAGAPVCANHFKLSIFNILTYMRIKDSLNESTSTFKAELNRLKMILTNVAVDKNSFVLIDEMLRGTNSRDKYLGSKVFIEKLISLATPTLFATHDLQLSELKEVYIEEVRNYHFDIQINNGEMNFDYKLKLGPCKTFNAAILLKEIGLSLN
jgi:DNA mismatch repair ATPase MutS